MSQIRIRALLNSLKNTIDTDSSKQHLFSTQASTGCLNIQSILKNPLEICQGQNKYNSFTLVHFQFDDAENQDMLKHEYKVNRDGVYRSTVTSSEKKTMKKMEGNKRSFTHHRRRNTCEENVEQLGIGKKLINFKSAAHQKSQKIPMYSTLQILPTTPTLKIRKPLFVKKDKILPEKDQQIQKSFKITKSSPKKKQQTQTLAIPTAKMFALNTQPKSRASSFRSKMKESTIRQQFKLSPWDNAGDAYNYYPLCY